ncbi:MAG: acetyl-CoA C-acyltransferase [Labilithrix sp.]|nr:acetyl-CoA C-acyltransferase [Labilithrix sp.]
MTAREAWVFDAVRTPRGTLKKDGGALSSVKPVRLVGVLLEALAGRGVDPARVDDVILGCSTQVGDQGANVAKAALLVAGWPEALPAQTVNRLCISGLEAVATAAAKVASGQCDVALAGGVESMSRVPMMADKGAWFADPEVAMASRFVHMGVSADVIATLDGRSREELDGVAVASHARAAAAARAGHAGRSVVAVRGADGSVVLEADDGVREETSLAKLAALPPAFVDFGAASSAVVRARYPELGDVTHLHTVATSPRPADGASLVVVATLEAGRAMGLEPRARVASYAALSSEPVAMLTGPAAAARRALDRAGRKPADVAVFEHNESFAATCLRFQADLDVDPARVNPLGGAIALGHPLGATGGMLIGTLVDELVRRDEPTGVVAMCAGAGLAAAMVLERR